MDKGSILHIPMSSYAYPLSENKVVIKLRTKRDDIKSCTLFYGDRSCRKNPIDFYPQPMEIVVYSQLFDWYQVEYISKFSRICYYFEIIDKYDKKTYYYGDQFYNNLVPDRSYYFQLPFLHRADIVKVPTFVNTLRVYNIFPDSFATSKRYISKKGLKKDYKGQITRSKLGGTINGIIETLDYIKELGFNCIYLNPIFVAGEYHKYDLIDYYHIDPCFGTDSDFKNLVNKLHLMNMKIIIDGVFNHCGWHFFAFEDVVKNGKKSKYWSFFYGLKEPVIIPDNWIDIPNYDCFGYERKMPKMATDNKEVEDYFCKVGEYWVKNFDIDGFRLDVANEINDSFWRNFNARVKAIKPNFLIIGEVWETANHWLDGTIFDSTMNYDFRRYLKSFITEKCSAQTFNDYVTTMLMRYKSPTLAAQLNLIDSHDVSRFFSVCKENIQLYKLVLVFLMTFPGIPCLFYGDELFLSGIKEDDYRRAMPWKNISLYKKNLNFTKKLVQLRATEEALQIGTFKTLEVVNHFYSFVRETDKYRIVVYINNFSSKHKININSNYEVLLSENFSSSISTINAYGFLIIKEKK